MPPKEKYSDPKLRDEIKEEIKADDKGGAPGQWSARKAQFMAKEYKKRGGGYNDDKSNQDESQKHLEKWTEEEWQTKEGSGNAKKEDGTQKRYLPKDAWDKMTEEEKEATDQKKQEGSKKGKQHVGNTSKAKQSHQKATDEEDERFEERKSREQQQEQDKNGTEKEDDHEEDQDNKENAKDAAEDGDQAYQENDEEAAKEDGDKDAANDDAGEDAGGADEKPNCKQSTAGQKRKPSERQASSKKQKTSSNKSGNSNAPAGTTGSKHMPDEAPAPRGSAERLPKKGQEATWKAMPGFVDGTVEEVLTSAKTIDGKSVKASKKDPKIVLKSKSSGKICVHKPDACFYD